MPRSFESAIIGGYFDKSVKVISGVNSEEGLIISAQFHKSPLRWNFFWNEWERWAPMILFNREANLVTEQDREKVMKAREKFFSVLLLARLCAHLTTQTVFNCRLEMGCRNKNIRWMAGIFGIVRRRGSFNLEWLVLGGC